jgi:hypothetical protein
LQRTDVDRIGRVLGQVEVCDREIADAVAATDLEMFEPLAPLVEAPTTLGDEAHGQANGDIDVVGPASERLEEGRRVVHLAESTAA